MPTTLSASSITRPQFEEILSHYASLVPDKLKQLDEKRLYTIPAAVEGRKSEGKKKNGGGLGGAYLTKGEVLELVDWKLSHGTFRPRLRDLVASNSNFESSTHDAFGLLLHDHPQDPDTSLLRTAMTQLTAFKGVGPATASLFLSTFDKDRYPFFGDEVYRWTMCDGEWGAKIGYTLKEYLGFVPRVREVAGRLGVGVREIECVAWVLGREGKEGRKGEKSAGKKGGGKIDGGEKKAVGGEKESDVGKVARKDGKTASKTAERDGKTKAKTVEKHAREQKSDDSSVRRSKRLKTED